MTSMSFGSLFVVIGDESALKIPKAVSGKTIDFKSLQVMSHMVYR
jgi:hypothetical protein